MFSPGKLNNKPSIIELGNISVPPTPASLVADEKLSLVTIMDVSENLYAFHEKYFLCPITNEILIDPVISPQGITFSYGAILLWLQKEKTCPVTGECLTPRDLIRNRIVDTLLMTKKRMSSYQNYHQIHTEILYTCNGTLSKHPIVNAEGITVESESAIPARDKYQNLLVKNLIAGMQSNQGLEQKSISEDHQENILLIPEPPPYYNNLKQVEMLQEARKHYARKACLAYFFPLFAFGIVGSVTGVFYLLLHYIFSRNTSNVTYSFEFSSLADAELCIHNPRSYPVTVKSLQFVINANIVDRPHGKLFPSAASLNKQIATAEQSYIYDIEFGNSILGIEEASKLCLSYHGENALGPLHNVFMPPSKVILNSEELFLLDACNDCNDPAPGYQIDGWYINWSAHWRRFAPSDIPVHLLNHISYGSIQLNSAGDVFLLDEGLYNSELSQIALLRQKYAYLNTSITFGGDCSARLFHLVINNATVLDNFISNAIAARKQAQADGIIIHWQASEWCEKNSEFNAAGFIKLFTQLKARDPEAVLQFTVRAAAVFIQQFNQTSWCGIAGAVDRIIIKTSEYKSNVTNYIAPLAVDPNDPTIANNNSISNSVNALLDMHCIKPRQLSISVPTWGMAMPVTDMGDKQGLWMPVNGEARGQFGSYDGLYDYKCIRLAECGDGRSLSNDTVLIPTEENFYGNETHEPRGYSQGQKIFITYEDEKSAAWKVYYAVRNNLTSITIADITQDVSANSAVSLIASVQQAFTKHSNYNNAQERVVGQSNSNNTANILNALQTARTNSVWSRIMAPVMGVYNYLSEKISAHAPEVVNELQTQLPRLLFNASMATAASLIANATVPNTINYSTPLSVSKM